MTLIDLPAITIAEADGNASSKGSERSAKSQDQYKYDQNYVFFRPSAVISPGQTLVSIAEHHFHDANLAWLIADLNVDQTTEHRMDGKRIVEVRSRLRLTLPVWQDVLAFYNNRPPESKPENIVTVVVSNEIDREVMHSFLGRVMGLPGLKKVQQAQAHARAAAHNDRKPRKGSDEFPRHPLGAQVIIN